MMEFVYKVFVFLFLGHLGQCFEIFFFFLNKLTLEVTEHLRLTISCIIK